jgi:hypothetical protein
MNAEDFTCEMKYSECHGSYTSTRKMVKYSKTMEEEVVRLWLCLTMRHRLENSEILFCKMTGSGNIVCNNCDSRPPSLKKGVPITQLES